MAERYAFAKACQFWKVPPWELEAREDALWWINEAAAMRAAENLAETIANDIAKHRGNANK